MIISEGNIVKTELSTVSQVSMALESCFSVDSDAAGLECTRDSTFLTNFQMVHNTDITDHRINVANL